VLSCFGFDGPRRRIVYEDGNFPSVRYLYQAHERRGADILVAADDEGVVEAIDERTLLVPVTHVLYKTGEIQDVEAIVARAHDVGAHVVLDAYQSAGTVPLDVTALGVDFAVGGSVKWLCGGPGAAWLYVRPELAATLEPAVTGWQAHVRPFAFEPEQEYAEGAARFLTGTPNVPALYAATAGYDVIEEVGVERIRERSVEQTTQLIELLDEAGFPTGSPRDPARRGGTVVVRTPDFERVGRQLLERDVILDWRPDVGLRLGPHFFNTDGELRFAVEQIAELSGRGARPAAARS
jgi:kynureninase